MSAAALTLALLATTPFVRAQVAPEAGAHCLWWGKKTVTWTQNTAGNPATGSRTFDAVSSAFQTWSGTLQGCGDLQLTEGPRSNSRKVGLEAGGLPNLNLVLFRYVSCARKAPANAPCWADGSCGNVYDCWDHATGLLGVTTLSYDTATGELLDADIELDGADNLFTVVDAPVCAEAPALTCVATDVQNTVTHEVGHLLGLAHSPSSRSTMSATSLLGDLGKRTLDDGSAEFACAVYPRGLPAQDCVAPTTPEGQSGCAAAPAGPGGLVAWLLLGWLGRGRRRARLAALAAVALAGVAQATTLVALDVSALTRASDLVVRATVVRSQARWTQDGGRIVTEVELEVLEAWKGAPARRLTVVQPGGTVGRVGQRVEGVARLEPGEEVVAFLEARGPAFTPTGLAQGAFRVERGDGAAGVVQKSAGAAHFLDALTGQEVWPAPLRLTLSELQAQVRAQAR